MAEPANSSVVHRWIGHLVGAVRLLIGVPRLAIIGFLKLYRWLVSPIFGETCRFYPSCSQYALTAVQRHGALRGSWLAGRRLLRCHPWNPGGVDHVPPASIATTPESGSSRQVAPTDQNSAPSAPRRAA